MLDEENKELPLEYHVFALSLKQEGSIPFFKEHLSPEYVGAIHGNAGLTQFYKSLLDFYDKTGIDPIDPIPFKSWLENETEIYEGLGGYAGVSTFFDVIQDIETTSPENVVAVLNHRAKKRKQLNSLQELQLLISKKEYKTDEERSKINMLTEQIRSIENDIGYDPLADVRTAKDIAQDVDNMWDLPPFFPTQFPSLNKALGYSETKGGIARGAITTILAASGLGKSTMCRSMCNHWVEAGYRVLFVNYEETKQNWESALFSQITKLNPYKKEFYSEQQIKDASEVFVNHLTKWDTNLIVKHSPDTPYFDDLEKWFRDILGHNENLPDIIIIDTIQSLFVRSGGNGQRWGQFEEMMVRLEKLAKDMNCAIVLTSQENSNRMKEKREVVQQSDAGGSLTIIQKSSVAIHITKVKMKGGEEIDETICELQISKNRITGSVFSSDPPRVRYEDDHKTYYSYEMADDEDYYGMDDEEYDEELI